MPVCFMISASHGVRGASEARPRMLESNDMLQAASYIKSSKDAWYSDKRLNENVWTLCYLTLLWKLSRQNWSSVSLCLLFFIRVDSPSFDANSRIVWGNKHSIIANDSQSTVTKQSNMIKKDTAQNAANSILSFANQNIAFGQQCDEALA